MSDKLLVTLDVNNREQVQRLVDLLNELDLLQGLSFVDADISDSVFIDAIIDNADFSGSHGKGVSFEFSVLNDCDFGNADLVDCNFEQAVVVNPEMLTAAFILKHGEPGTCALDEELEVPPPPHRTEHLNFDE